MAACFCTLAIGAPYRRRARLLCADLGSAPWFVLTDDPGEFHDLPVTAIRHLPSGPTASDYLRRHVPTGNGRGAASYHDKRYALRVALRDFDTAVFLDADSRAVAATALGAFPAGLSVLPVVTASIAAHLGGCGTWRLPHFEHLAEHLTGDTKVLHTARWCHESCYAVTKDGNEASFFEAWDRAAEFLQQRGVYSGEGGVMGLAAACAGWPVTDDEGLATLAAAIHHEGGGPKED